MVKFGVSMTEASSSGGCAIATQIMMNVHDDWWTNNFVSKNLLRKPVLFDTHLREVWWSHVPHGAALTTIDQYRSCSVAEFLCIATTTVQYMALFVGDAIAQLHIHCGQKSQQHWIFYGTVLCSIYYCSHPYEQLFLYCNTWNQMSAGPALLYRSQSPPLHYVRHIQYKRSCVVYSIRTHTHSLLNLRLDINTTRP